MRLFLALFFVCFMSFYKSYSQGFKSIHQEELEYYDAKGLNSDYYYNKNKSHTALMPQLSKNCTLNKIVFGWHPYWVNGLESNYAWHLLSDLSYFSYEVNPNTGQANNLYNWSTAPVIDSALAHGVRVNLCITMFSNHAVFFSSSTAQQTLITNLISLIQQRNAHGVNIDFEAVPFAQKANLTSFVINLSTQMKAAIPGAQISIALPAVDWSGTFDVAAMGNHVDIYLIMGYDYYYAGSSQAGPTDPLYTHVASYDRNLSRSINYYLNQGIPSHKLALGVPYYGREWEVTANTIPANTSGNFNSSRTYKVIKDNVNGYYNTPINYPKSMSTYYAFQVGGAWRQCFANTASNLGRRYDMVNQRQLAGIGIWALGYDNGYTDLWQTIENKFTNCAVVPCVDTIYDLGGPQGNYYTNETLTYTIEPTNATALSLNFNHFNLGSNDTLKLFNGSTVNSPLIGAFTGSTMPNNIIATHNALTLSFKSSNMATSSGWEAVWQCVYSMLPPATSINPINLWQSTDFSVSFNDIDNAGSGLKTKFYQVSDNYDGLWSANTSKGFMFDGFSQLNTQLWSIPANGGNWTIQNNALVQTNESIENSNIYAAINQNIDNAFIYHFRAKIEGTDNQKRYGFHFFADSAQYLNRKNSYFIWFRQANNTLELYKVTNDVFSIIATANNVTTNTSQWYDVKIAYNKLSGEINIYRDNVLLLTHIDTNPIINNGNYISFRSAKCRLHVDSLNIYRSRNSNPLITVGNTFTKEIRFENSQTTQPAGLLKSIIMDNNNMLSNIDYAYVNVDWTPPANVSWVNDGLSSDIDTVYSAVTLSANWAQTNDNLSGVKAYWYAIGNTPNATDVVGWTSNQLNQHITHTNLQLTNGHTYYFSVKAEDHAGLFSYPVSSNGQKVVAIATPAFIYNTNTICSGQNIMFNNTSINTTHVEWYFSGGLPAYSTNDMPTVSYNASGVYNVMLIAHNGVFTDTLLITNLINVLQNPQAIFNAVDTTYMPNAIVVFNNTSLYAQFYDWDFGDGNSSNDTNPWHVYNQTGTYDVKLIASNTHCTDTAYKTITIAVLSNFANQKAKPKMDVYPNPFTEELFVRLCMTANEVWAISITDILGQKLFEETNTSFSDDCLTIDLNKVISLFKSGTYIIRLNSETFKYHTKLIKI